MDKFRQGLLGMMADPMFQAGVGLLGRTDMPFGRALGGTMNDMAASQMMQQRFQAAQQAQEQQKQAEAWYQQNGMGGVPADVRQQMLERMFAKPQQTQLMQNLAAAGLAPGTPEYQQAVLQTLTKPLVQNTQAAQMPTAEQIRSEDAKAFAELDRKWVLGLSDNASNARSNLPSYRRASALLDTVSTGSLEQAKIEAKKLANAFGVEVDLNNIASAEELQVFLGDQLMERVAQTKGAVSNKEMELFERFSASFGKTTQGNKQILRFKIAQAERDIELQKLAYQMRKEGRPAGDIRRALERYIDENSLAGLLTIEDKPQGQRPDQKTVESLLEIY